MTNELQVVQQNLEGMDFQQIQAIINKSMAIQNQQLHKFLQDLKEDHEKLSEEMQIVKSRSEDLRDMEIKRHRVTEHMFGFVSLNDLGQCFQVSIGSKTMGKLLRVVGLAKAKQSKTEPLRSAIIDGYAKSLMYNDHPTYQWNPEKCIDKIERWLNGQVLIDKFYAIEDESELAEFIKSLDETYTQ